MNLNIVYPILGTGIGGSIISGGLVTDYVSKKGFDTHVVIPTSGRNHKFYSSLDTSVKQMGFTPTDVRRISSTRGILSKLRATPIHYHAFKYALEFIDKENIDIVHVNNDRALLSWGLAAKTFNVPVIWHVRQRSGNIWLDVIRYGLASYLIFIAGDTRKRLKYLPSVKPSSVIHNPVDTKKFRPPESKSTAKLNLNLDPSRITIGFVGRFVEWKRPWWIARVTKDLLEMGHNVQCVYVGDHTAGEKSLHKIKEIARKSANTSFFHLLGYRSDVSEVMKALDILGLSSVDEPFGRVVIEAMACGVPVVATGGGGVSEITSSKNEVLIVPPNSYRKFRSSITSLVENTNKRKKLSIRGRERVESKFDVESISKKVLDVYSEILHNRDSPISKNK